MVLHNRGALSPQDLTVQFEVLLRSFPRGKQAGSFLAESAELLPKVRIR